MINRASGMPFIFFTPPIDFSSFARRRSNISASFLLIFSSAPDAAILSISFNFLIEAFRVLKLVNIPPNQRILIYGMPARAASNAMASRAPRLAPTNRIVPRPAEIRRAYCSASRYIGSVFSRLIIWILLRWPKIYGAIFGFQKRVWCPKWTPASSISRIVTDMKSLPKGWDIDRLRHLLEPFSAAYTTSLRARRMSSLRGRLHRYAMETCSARIDLHTVFALVPCAISLKKALKIRVQAPWMRRSGIHALLAFPSVVSGKPTEAT